MQNVSDVRSALHQTICRLDEARGGIQSVLTSVDTIVAFLGAGGSGARNAVDHETDSQTAPMIPAATPGTAKQQSRDAAARNNTESTSPDGGGNVSWAQKALHKLAEGDMTVSDIIAALDGEGHMTQDDDTARRREERAIRSALSYLASRGMVERVSDDRGAAWRFVSWTPRPRVRQAHDTTQR